MLTCFRHASSTDLRTSVVGEVATSMCNLAVRSFTTAGGEDRRILSSVYTACLDINYIKTGIRVLKVSFVGKVDGFRLVYLKMYKKQ